MELPINVSDAKLWEGVRLRYWQLDTYYLPIVQHDDDEEKRTEPGHESQGDQQLAVPQMQRSEVTMQIEQQVG